MIIEACLRLLCWVYTIFLLNDHPLARASWKRYLDVQYSRKKSCEEVAPKIKWHILNRSNGEAPPILSRSLIGLRLLLISSKVASLHPPTTHLPIGPRQGYYRNQVKKAPLPAYLQGKEKDDELLEVLLKMKSEEEPFIRKVSLEKENLTIVLASEDHVSRVGKVQHIRTGLLHCSARSHIQSGTIRMCTDFLQKPFAKKQEKWYISSKARSHFDSLSKRRENFLRLPPDRSSRKFCLVARIRRQR